MKIHTLPELRTVAQEKFDLESYHYDCHNKKYTVSENSSRRSCCVYVDVAKKNLIIYDVKLF